MDCGSVCSDCDGIHALASSSASCQLIVKTLKLRKAETLRLGASYGAERVICYWSSRFELPFGNSATGKAAAA